VWPQTILLKAEPSSIEHGEAVVISWSNMWSEENDLVAIYCPFQHSQPDDFIDYKFVEQQVSGISIAIRLLSLRIY
jgi:hypothetical protein